MRTIAILLCFLAAILPEAMAQDVLTAPPASPATPAAVQEHQAESPFQVFGPNPLGPASPFVWGPVTLHPSVNYQFTYGNGLQSSPGSQHDSIVQSLSPGLLMNIGPHWTLDYTPTFTFYSSSAFQNTINHNINVGWGSSYENWFLSASQGVSISSNPDTQTGAQTDQQNYNTALGASYQFNDKMSMDLGLDQNLNFVSYNGSVTNNNQNLANSQTWSTTDWLNYKFADRLNAGIGTGLGYTMQQNSANSVFEQVQGRVNWRATDKLSFQLSGGIQTQQYMTNNANNLLAPLSDCTIQYQPFEQTRLSLSGSRNVSPSDYQNQTTENYSLTLDLNQRLLGKLFLDLSGNYSHTKYHASVTDLATDRNDDTYTFNARLSYAVLKRGNISVFYTYTDNQSSQNGFANGSDAYSYTSNQVGFDVGYSY